MTNVLKDLLWVEKYRPTTLDGLALSPENRAVLAAYLAAGEVPHLLLCGPPGFGKTTIARILYNSLDCRTLVLNASNERGIDTVRAKIGTFITTKTGSRWNIVFLDEADGMGADAQTALKNMIEAYASRARFILTANKPHRIIGPIKDRCVSLSFTAPPLKERYRILADVLQQESIEADTATVLSYAEKCPSMRQILMVAQRAYLAHGKLPPAQQQGGIDGVGIFELLTSNNWTGLRRLTTSDMFDPYTGLVELFWAVPDDHARAGFLRHVIGRAIHESGFTPDPIVHFLGLCAEALEGLA